MTPIAEEISYPPCAEVVQRLFGERLLPHLLVPTNTKGGAAVVWSVMASMYPYFYFDLVRAIGRELSHDPR